MMTSPLVVLFHPPDPLCVGVVVGLETDRCGLSSAEFLVGDQGNEQATHELRKTETLDPVLSSDSVLLVSLGIC